MRGVSRLGRVTVIVSAIALTAASAADPGEYAPLLRSTDAGTYDWETGVVAGAASEKIDTSRNGSRARLVAREKGEERARQSVVELVRSLARDGETWMRQEAAMMAALREGSASGGKAKFSEKRGAYEVSLDFPLHGRKGLYGALVELLPEVPASPPADAGDGSGAVTSIVLDGRDTSLQPALFPRLLDDSGALVHGPRQVDRKALEQWGAVAYVVPAGEGKASSKAVKARGQRLGPNPLVLPVKKIAGDLFADVVLTPEQIETLGSTPGAARALSEGRLFIVLKSDG